MTKFRKKPVEIEAIQWIGTNENFKEIQKLNANIVWHTCHDILNIPTPEGNMTAQLNDWIIKGIQGETYPCKPDVFIKTYEIVE
jgi:hypothetical protein